MHSENKVEVENQDVIDYRQRVGLVLLGLFSAVYFGFIGLCAFANTWFSSLLLSGVPATVWYGFV